VEVVGVEGEDEANSRLTSWFIARRPRSPSSPSELLSWDNSLCHRSWEGFSLVVGVVVKSNCRDEGLDIMISRKCFRFRGLDAENVKSPLNTSTNNK
jgi:hypothetical protein